MGFNSGFKGLMVKREEHSRSRVSQSHAHTLKWREQKLRTHVYKQSCSCVVPLQ